MELTISVSEQIGHILQQRAKANGRDITDFVKDIVEDQALTPTLDDLLAPVRQEVTDKAITEDEIDDFMYALRRKVRNEKGTVNKS
jgi:uncharacterized protein (DUF1778 family)